MTKLGCLKLTDITRLYDQAALTRRVQTGITRCLKIGREPFQRLNYMFHLLAGDIVRLH